MVKWSDLRDVAAEYAVRMPSHLQDQVLASLQQLVHFFSKMLLIFPFSSGVLGIHYYVCIGEGWTCHWQLFLHAYISLSILKPS